MIGSTIKNLRKQRGLTQTKFAEELNEKYNLNIERSMVSKWETGSQIPMVYTISCMADYFGVSIDFITEEGKSKSNSTDVRTVRIPVYAAIPAGIPLEAIEDIIDWEEISPDMAKQGDFFALRVKGDSMEPRIKDGDVVIVRSQQAVDNGDVAVVMVNASDATLKRFHATPSGVKLLPDNPAHNPLFFSPAEVEQLPVRVIGKVVELRAKF